MRRSLAAPAVLALSVLAAGLAPLGAAGPLRAAEEPALSVPPDAAAAALRCPAGVRAGRAPVLLVHGTFTNADESWSWGYAPALARLGYDACTVTLPDRAMGDIQVSAEYVVAAVRALAGATGEQVDLVTHSQGGLETRWALRWWESVRGLVDDLVLLAAPNHGTALVTAQALGGFSCPACWQMRPGSAFLTALNGGDETPGAVSYTSLYSLTDVVVPQLPPPPTSALEGARNVLVQDACAGRPVDHLGFLGDAVVFSLVVDALAHPGPADPARLSPLACLQTVIPGADPAGLVAVVLGEAAHPTVPAELVTSSEPPLAPYARP